MKLKNGRKVVAISTFSHFESWQMLMLLFREFSAHYETNMTEMRLKSQNYQLQ